MHQTVTLFSALSTISAQLRLSICSDLDPGFWASSPMFCSSVFWTERRSGDETAACFVVSVAVVFDSEGALLLSVMTVVGLQGDKFDRSLPSSDIRESSQANFGARNEI